MRISDWSSDVCSSDLVVADEFAHVMRLHRRARDDRLLARADHDRGRAIARFGADDAVEFGFGGHRDRGVDEAGVDLLTALDALVEIAQHIARQRSEEHTSELQSLMRISYAVFCLKKKKNTKKQTF